MKRRIITEDVEGMAAFYACLVGTSVTLNEYCVLACVRARPEPGPHASRVSAAPTG